MQRYCNERLVSYRTIASDMFHTLTITSAIAIVTGGALGIGEAYVRALVASGAFVVIADLSEEAGNKLHHEFPLSTAYVVCDVTSWESQLSVFKKAKEVSPTFRIDIVVANAGVSNADQVFFNDIEKDEPEKPKLHITDVNIVGVLFTTKLALWYFRKQNANGAKQDQSLVLQGSVTGYVDIYGAPQYTVSKFAVRGLMRSLRQPEQAHGIRVNLIAPWYVRPRGWIKD